MAGVNGATGQPVPDHVVEGSRAAGGSVIVPVQRGRELIVRVWELRLCPVTLITVQVQYVVSV